MRAPWCWLEIFSSSHPVVHRPLCSFEEGPQHLFISKAEILPGTQYHIPTLPVKCYLNFHCGNVVVTTEFPFHCHSLKKSPVSSDFLPDPVVISFSCPVCCRALISCSVSSFSLSLRAAALCQPGSSLVFRFPICLLSAIGPPLTCGSLFPCSPCVFLAWVWLFAVPRPDLAAWLIVLVWSTAVNLFLFPDSSQQSFLCFQVLFFFKVSCIIWHILNFSPLALVLLHQLLHFNFPAKTFYQKFPGVPCLCRAGFDLSPAALSVSKQRGKQPWTVTGCCAGCVGSLWYSPLFSFPSEGSPKGGDTPFFCTFLLVMFGHFGTLFPCLYFEPSSWTKLCGYKPTASPQSLQWLMIHMSMTGTGMSPSLPLVPSEHTAAEQDRGLCVLLNKEFSLSLLCTHKGFRSLLLIRRAWKGHFPPATLLTVQ